MKLHYYPETDSLYIELKAAPGAERRGVSVVVVDDFEKLGDRLDGTLKVMREIAKIAARKG